MNEKIKRSKSNGDKELQTREHTVDYDKLKKQMRQLIRLANEVIVECEKDAPDDVLISDDTTEELFELTDQVITTVNGLTPVLA